MVDPQTYITLVLLYFQKLLFDNSIEIPRDFWIILLKDK